MSKTKAKKVDTRPIAGGDLATPDTKRHRAEGRVFVFTSAQNNTYVHKRFLQSLLCYVQYRGAKLYVSPFTYNKNGFQNGTKDNEEYWYDPKIKPYLTSASIEIAKDLVFCGELNILPTAVNPLSGLENYTRHQSSIVPHAKVQMKSVATMKHDPTKFLYTTGAVTLRNYIQKKSGQKASFHHVFGALVVEIDDDGDWFARQLVASNDGTFYDLSEKFTPTRVIGEQRVAGINWGDLHSECRDELVFEGAFSQVTGSMLDTLRPRYQFAHDLTDFRARNHHGINDPYFLAANFQAGMDSVEEGLRKSATMLWELYRPWCETIVVESNHHQALRRWLSDIRGHLDPVNARYWHKMNTYMHECIAKGETPAPFEHALRQMGVGPKEATFLEEDTSFELCPQDEGPGIECGMHGHRGPNGSRGNINSLRAVGKRANIGHTHSAGIMDGVYVAGVSAKLDLDYNVGPSSWSHSHIVTYPNSKRTIVTMRGKKWRAI